MEIFPNDQEMDREKFMKDVRRWKGRAWSPRSTAQRLTVNIDLQIPTE
jgi:hypothetical protein